MGTAWKRSARGARAQGRSSRITDAQHRRLPTQVELRSTQLDTGRRKHLPNRRECSPKCPPSPRLRPSSYKARRSAQSCASLLAPLKTLAHASLSRHAKLAPQRAPASRRCAPPATGSRAPGRRLGRCRTRRGTSTSSQRRGPSPTLSLSRCRASHALTPRKCSAVKGAHAVKGAACAGALARWRSRGDRARPIAGPRTTKQCVAVLLHPRKARRRE